MTKPKEIRDSKGRFVKGNIGWNKGKKGLQKSHRKGLSMIEEYGEKRAKELIEDHRKKITGKIFSKEVNLKKGRKGKLNVMARTDIRAIHKIACQNKERNLKISLKTRGEKNHNWKGGYKNYYGEDWKYQRKLAIEKYGKVCNICKTDKKIVVHHKIPYRISKDNSLENLMPLCRSCHGIIENRGDNIGAQTKTALA